MTRVFNISGADWEPLLRRSTVVENIGRLSAIHAEKAVMITGAGGSIGSALALQVAESNPRLLILLDVSEQNLYQVQMRIDRIASRNLRKVAVLGSVTDRDLLDNIFQQNQPDLVYHAAAHKHVPLLETNPFAAIRNNAIGTHCLARAAVEHGVRQMLMISTDKAANPSGIMGASKRIAELALQSACSKQTKMDSIRLGNVLGSQGSVVPYFLEQILHNGPVTVTHPDVERFFLTMEEAVSLLFEAAACASGKQIYVPEIGRPVKIIDLAKYLIGEHESTPAGEIPIVFTGLRAGEKMQEEFVASDELLGERVSERLHHLISSSLPTDAFASAMADLDRTIRTRNLDAMLQVVQGLVPQYKPRASLNKPSTTSMVELHG